MYLIYTEIIILLIFSFILTIKNIIIYIMEDIILKENIISKGHIDEIYNLFVNICNSNDYKIKPKDFLEVFQNLSDKKSLNINKEVWSQMFLIIDQDKDGGINFQDLLKFIYNNLKLIWDDIYDNFTFNKF